MVLKIVSCIYLLVISKLYSFPVLHIQFIFKVKQNTLGGLVISLETVRNGILGGDTAH